MRSKQIIYEIKQITYERNKLVMNFLLNIPAHPSTTVTAQGASLQNQSIVKASFDNKRCNVEGRTVGEIG